MDVGWGKVRTDDSGGQRSVKSHYKAARMHDRRIDHLCSFFHIGGVDRSAVRSALERDVAIPK